MVQKGGQVTIKLKPIIVVKMSSSVNYIVCKTEVKGIVFTSWPYLISKFWSLIANHLATVANASDWRCTFSQPGCFCSASRKYTYILRDVSKY